VGRRAWLGVLAAAGLALALRIPFVGEPVYPDEGGYLLVARQWQAGGSSLYGDLFVDRPPLMILFWQAMDALGGVETARWLVCLWVVVLVVVAAWAGRLVGGDRGAVWSAFVAAALASTPALGAREADGELLAAPLLMASCTFTLMALRHIRSALQACWAALAGFIGAAAVLVKQNLVDALIFAVVLVVASVLAGSLPRRKAVRILGWGAAGSSVPILVTAVWAAGTAPGVSGLWYAMYGFRADAAQVVFSQSFNAPLSRLVILLGATVVSGLAVMVALYVVCSWLQLRRGDPFTVAVTAMLVVGGVGVALGASYWAHYLIGLVPVLCLAVASLAGQPSGRRRLALGTVTLAAASGVVAAIIAAGLTVPSRTTETALAQLLSSAGHSTDSVVITYGHPNVIEQSGLSPGYPYLWSLPMRVLDPQLDLLTRTVSSPTAPTWLVQWEGFNSWGIDADNRLATAVSRRYRQVATVCGVAVLLRHGRTRSLPSEPDPCD